MFNCCIGYAEKWNTGRLTDRQEEDRRLCTAGEIAMGLLGDVTVTLRTRSGDVMVTLRSSSGDVTVTLRCRSGDVTLVLASLSLDPAGMGGLMSRIRLCEDAFLL